MRARFAVSLALLLVAAPAEPLCWWDLDFDSDGELGLRDFFLFADHFGTRSDEADWDPIYDLDDNGEINLQDFFRFELRASQSVGVGDSGRIDDLVAVSSAVGRAGADDVIDKLAYGLETQLGPTWDQGVELSFGQWQKLALARGFMSDEPLLLILDEPTAALDAETEHALFERFASAARSGEVEGSAQGRVTILVSHRFSTVRMADLIVVLDGSKIAEVGSHDELMANDGPYASLYEIQASAYR